MRALILFLAASALTASPVLAQHQGHHMPAPAKKPAAKPAAKKPAAKKPAAKKAATKKMPMAKKAAPTKKPATKPAAQPDIAPPPVDPHAGHAMPAPPADPHAGHAMPAPTDDPHGGHTAPVAAADPHAGHDMGAAAEVPVGPPPPEALQGPAHAADAVWGAGMGDSRAVLIREHGGMATSKVLLDRAETRIQKGRDGYALDAEGWAGGDIDKLWLKSEIEGAWGEKPERAEVQGLWSHAIGPFFDLHAGVRADFAPKSRARAVIGVQGLAPYWMEVDAAAFVSTRGDITARFKAEHDARITQRLILQPAIELDFALQNIADEHVGAGLSTAEAGLRLRYEISPQFAPYVGVNVERAFGQTRHYLREEGDDPTAVSLVLGLRAWF
jgi:copper resistance protein B